MASNYIIDFSDPAVPSFVLAPGETNNDTSLRLYGQGATQYGEGMNENVLHLLENFAAPTASAPDLATAIIGQLFFDKTLSIFKFFNGTDFVSAGSVFVGTSAPPAPNVTGQLWFDTSVPQLKVFDGATFISVADRYLLLAGGTMTGFLTLNADPISDLQAATKIYVDNNSLPVVSGTTEVTSFVTINDDTGTSVLGNTYSLVIAPS